MFNSGFTDKSVPDQTGKTALITGANTGLGFEAARVLAGKGAEVIIACRSEAKAQSAVDKIQGSNPAAQISSVELDLGSLSSIKDCVQQLDHIEHLDLLINNAGIMVPPFELTQDGFESQFGVNHLGPFALTGQLLSKLQQTEGARIVNTSSLAGRYGRLYLDDPNAESGYNAMQRYKMSKLANLLFANELNKRLADSDSKAISVCCHPGIATTELSRHLPKWATVAQPVITGLFNSPHQGAWPTLQAATDPKAQGGDCYGPSRFRQTSGPSERVKLRNGPRDKKLASELWHISEQMTGNNYQF